MIYSLIIATLLFFVIIVRLLFLLKKSIDKIQRLEFELFMHNISKELNTESGNESANLERLLQ